MLSVVLGAAFFTFTKARYRKLSQIAKQINLVLYNADRFELGNFDEGELSILHSEITKMTLRIREQNEMLKKERQYLADSLADIAHQLRTPLTSATLILSLLAETSGKAELSKAEPGKAKPGKAEPGKAELGKAKPGKKAPDETSPDTDKTERKVHPYEIEELLMRMDWLITTLLKISRLDAGVAVFQNEPIRLSELLKSALRPLAIPLELRGVNVLLDVSEEMVIQGDAGWLSEAFQNILKNCMESVSENKANEGRADENRMDKGETGEGETDEGRMDSGGANEGEMEETGTNKNGWIEISCKKTPLFVEVSIRDNGAGFAKEDLPHVFDRFYRGKSNNSLGYGIGLALSKTIITQQNGIINAYNHPNGGAAFSVRFPCVFDA